MSGLAVIVEERLRIPASAHDLPEFRRWAASADFPDGPRIDFVEGDLEVEMSPENLFSHGAVKTAIARSLDEILTDGDRGQVFVDRARVTEPRVGLSVEPDVVALLWESVEQQRVRFVAGARQEPGQYVEIEGAPDLIVEIVSDGSVHKDTVRLPPLYHRAGVRELWHVDARGTDLIFQISASTEDGYHRSLVDADGFQPSRVLGVRVRLVRTRSRVGTWRYTLERR